MARSTVERTLVECRRRGWSAAKVENWVAIPGHPGGGVRRDLWAVGDVLAIVPGQSGCLMIQSTAGRGDVARHLRKLEEAMRDWSPPKAHPQVPEPIRAWVRAGNRLAIWSWAKRGARGKRKLWTVAEHEAVIADE